MRGHYLHLIEKELGRLWVGKMNVLVVNNGKDKFTVAGENKSVYAKGHQISKLLKTLPDRSGEERMWKALEPLIRK
jgi:hypothetical protein